MHRAAAMALAAIALGATGADRLAPSQARGVPQWREIAWPFPRDGWPAGRAFRCDGACAGAELYVRAKRGFCNCDRGVADDDEVDRVADVDLISPRFAAIAPGDVVRVGDLQGRIRRYDLDRPDEAGRVAVGVAVSRGCDLLVAVVQGAGEVTAAERAALAFLGTDGMKAWATAVLDGK